MLHIDSTKFFIELTRGDNATITFSAKDKEGISYIPVSGDKLIFTVSSDYGKDPLFKIENRYDDLGEYFWDIRILPEHTKPLAFGDYVYDVQLENAEGNIDTIIGKTDTIKPKFRVWKEVTL